MKKSVEASDITSTSKNERKRNTPFRKPGAPDKNVIGSTKPNDQDSLDDELPISGRTDTDKEAGMNTPSE